MNLKLVSHYDDALRKLPHALAAARARPSAVLGSWLAIRVPRRVLRGLALGAHLERSAAGADVVGGTPGTVVNDRQLKAAALVAALELVGSLDSRHGGRAEETINDALETGDADREHRKT